MSVESRLQEVIILLYSAILISHLEHCVQFCIPYFKTDQLEEVLERIIKMVRGLETKPYIENLILFSL